MENEVMETKVGGLRAVEVLYRGIRGFESGDITFLQSKTKLNTPDLGTLMPENYRKVAELSNQCVSLFELELAQVLESVKNLQKRDYYFRWMSVYMPLKYLEMRGMQHTIVKILEEAEIDTNRICFELTPDILVDGNQLHSRNIENLRNRGFHFMITEFGGVNSPLMRLAYFPVDYVQLSRAIIGYLKDDDRSLSAVSSMVEFAQGLGAESIADGVSTVEQAEKLYQAQCLYGTGPLIGKFVGERYLRKKNGEE
jgi:EAL domain-containing protein (putative c-di-GMP-specific phosphodiesterase class I)